MIENINGLLEGLNSEQREAVEINSGSLLVFAGAGSGKTRVITTKIAYAIKVLGIEPWRILAVTFTNKACREMRDRVESYIGSEDANRTVIRTFHSFGVRLLRKYGTRVGLSPNFSIYDDKEAVVLLSQCFPGVQKKEIEDAVKKISALKDNMQRPPKYDSKLVELYNAYNNKLAETGNVDFADMILKSIELLASNPDVKDYIHNRFKVILVDEYQDSNTAQFILLQHLVGKDTFICVVGDDDQSIYRFRGAQVENILNFPKIFPNTKTVVLGRNYRCNSAILNVAQDVIKNNVSRAKKNLQAEKRGGSKPVLYLVDSEADEAQMVVNIIKQNPPGRGYSTAVLYRTNAQSKAFEDRFIVNGIPYTIVGSLKFYDREEIRDSIALISLLVNPFDSVGFQRMINKPSRGIGDVSINKILNYGGSCIDACANALNSGEIKGKAASGVLAFLKSYEETRKFMENSDNGTMLAFMLKSFGLIDYYTKRDAEESGTDSNRVANLSQLSNMLSTPAFSDGLEGLHSFLEFVTLDPSSLGSADNHNNDASVTLITMHNTKGLEFDRVFISGMEDEIFPSLRTDSSDRDLEEERRIFYVAITRAKSELYLFSAKMRFQWGHQEYHTPSRFLGEIDKDHIEVKDLRSSLSRERFGGFSERTGESWGYGSDSWSGSYYNKLSYGNNFNGFNGDDNYDYGSSYYSGSYRGKNAIDEERKRIDMSFSSLKEGRSVYLNTNPYSSYASGKTKAKLATVKAVKIPKSEQKPPVKEHMEYNAGDRVHSELLGDGLITSKRKFGKKDLLDVKFDSGKTATFVSDKADLKKIN